VVHCQSRLPQISEEASGSDDDVSSECVVDGESGSEFGSSDGAPAKSALTSYSMTSSVLPRNENLTLLDVRFEKVILMFYCSYCSMYIISCLNNSLYSVRSLWDHPGSCSIGSIISCLDAMKGP